MRRLVATTRLAVAGATAILLLPSAAPAGAQHPRRQILRTILLGHSVRGRPIRAFELGDRTAPATIVVGVIHGSEPAGLGVVRRLTHAQLPRGAARRRYRSPVSRAYRFRTATCGSEP